VKRREKSFSLTKNQTPNLQLSNWYFSLHWLETFRQRKWQRKKIFILSTASRLALVFIQPVIQSETGTLSLWVEWVGYEADHSTPSTAEVKNEWSHTHKALGRIYFYLIP
jgi:hypothetical protein